MGTALIFTETKDRKDKADGREFRSQAIALRELWSEDKSIDEPRLVRMKRESRIEKQDRVLDAIAEVDNLERVAFFCHGYIIPRNGISLGFRLREVPLLADEIADSCTSGVVHIGLYACLTGRGNFWWWLPKRFKSLRDRKKNIDDRREKIVTHREGFAMYLCSQLRDRGVSAVITAHLTAGHTTRNPYKVLIRQDGEYITRTRMCKSLPRGKWKIWTRRLIDDIKFRFDSMMGGNHERNDTADCSAREDISHGIIQGDTISVVQD
jgi:hypothetical protein